MIVTAGKTNVSVYFYIQQDAGAANPGEPQTGLAYTDLTSGSYCRQGGLRANIAPATLATVDAAHSDGGFIEVDSTNMPGVYRFDPPDAAFVTGVDQVIIDINPGANRVCAPIAVDVSDVDLRDAGDMGVTVLNDWVNGQRLDLLIDAIKAVTDLLPDGGALTTIGTDTARLTAARAQVLTDWIDAGRLDLLLDGVKAVTDLLPDAGALSDLALILADTAVIGTPAGASIAADIAATPTLAELVAEIDAVQADIAALNDPTVAAIADGLLARNIAGGSDGGRDVTSALRILRNKVSIAAGTMTVTEEDDTTSAWTAVVATTAGNPISSVDPA